MDWIPPLIAIVAVVAVIAAVRVSTRRGPVAGLSHRPSEPITAKRVQQSARDYIASGAVPRWD